MADTATPVTDAALTTETPAEAEVEIPEGLLPTVFTGSLCPSNDY